MKTPLRNVLAAGILISGILNPRPASAQFEAVTKLFEEVHSIAIYGQHAIPNSDNVDGRHNCFLGDGLCGVGAEVLIDIGENSGPHIELGLGASYLSGLSVDAPDFDLRAGVRSFPTISVYRSGLPITTNLEWYYGGHIGLIELQNAQSYDSDSTERAVSASTFETGATAGLYAEYRQVGIFAEVSHRWRRFSSLDYATLDSDTGRIPFGWPRELDLSGFVVSFGAQFRIKPDEKPAPSVWILALADARDLPAVVQSAPGNARQPDGTVRQRRVLFGMLNLTAPANAKQDTAGTYRLQVHSRWVTLNDEGVVQRTDTLEVRTEQGAYSLSTSTLTLRPDANSPDQRPYMGSRVGGDLLIRDRVLDAPLLFRRPGAEPPAKKEEASDSGG